MHTINSHKEPNVQGIYIGRGSVYGNPFRLEEHGYREEAVSLYEGFFVQKLQTEQTQAGLKWLLKNHFNNDSKLRCFCAPLLCHGDIIIKYAKHFQSFDTIEEALMKLPEHPPNPLDDGKTHINVYSKAATKLGQLLSNFTLAPFIHPEFGAFNSVEGFWYWLGTGCKHDKLRTLHGYEAKKFGKKLERVLRDDFEDHIKLAIRLKIEADPSLYSQFIRSELPLFHYYYWGTPSNAKVLEPLDGRWITKYLNDLRDELKQGSTK